jgi:hypothetical protein
VARDADGYWQLKPTEKAGNPFEKIKLARDPLKHLLHLGEVTELASRVEVRSLRSRWYSLSEEARAGEMRKQPYFFFSSTVI